MPAVWKSFNSGNNFNNVNPSPMLPSYEAGFIPTFMDGSTPMKTFSPMFIWNPPPLGTFMKSDPVAQPGILIIPINPGKYGNRANYDQNLQDYHLGLIQI